jgi:hypothetical protein
MADKNRITVRLSENHIDKLNRLQNVLQLDHKSDLIRLLIDVIHGRLEREVV